MSENLRTEKITAFSISGSTDHHADSIVDLIMGGGNNDSGSGKGGGDAHFISDVK